MPLVCCRVSIHAQKLITNVHVCMCMDSDRHDNMVLTDSAATPKWRMPKLQCTRHKNLEQAGKLAKLSIENTRMGSKFLGNYSK